MSSEETNKETTAEIVSKESEIMQSLKNFSEAIQRKDAAYVIATQKVSLKYHPEMVQQAEEYLTNPEKADLVWGTLMQGVPSIDFSVFSEKDLNCEFVGPGKTDFDDVAVCRFSVTIPETTDSNALYNPGTYTMKLDFTKSNGRWYPATPEIDPFENL